MPQCIFCEDEDLPEETEECPNCGKKPFSGMYFDDAIYDEVNKLEKNGKSKMAWTILHEQWREHSDIDYFDDQMYHKLLSDLHNLFLRNKALIEERIKLQVEVMQIERFWSHFASENTLIEGIQIATAQGRDDFAQTLVEEHWSINHQHVHPKPDFPSNEEILTYIDKHRHGN